jgi:hypothetical protein
VKTHLHTGPTSKDCPACTPGITKVGKGRVQPPHRGGYKRLYPETLMASRDSVSGCLCGSFDPDDWVCKLPGQDGFNHVLGCHRIIAAELLDERVETIEGDHDEEDDDI